MYKECAGKGVRVEIVGWGLGGGESYLATRESVMIIIIKKKARETLYDDDDDDDDNDDE